MIRGWRAITRGAQTGGVVIGPARLHLGRVPGRFMLAMRSGARQRESFSPVSVGSKSRAGDPGRRRHYLTES